MDKTEVFIARHGETAFNKVRKLQGRGINAPLNKTGEQQAHALGCYTKAYRLNAIYSSTLKRALCTAQIVADYHTLPVTSYKDLEEMSYGAYEGASYKSVAQELEHIKQQWEAGNTSLQIQGGESPVQVYKRADKRIKQVVARHPGQSILFVLHGRLIRILLAQWLKGNLRYMHQINHVNCGINKLSWKNETFSPIYLNKVSHLNGIK